MTRGLAKRGKRSSNEAVPRVTIAKNPALENNQLLITRAEAARRLSVSIDTIERMELERQIEGVSVRRRRMVYLPSLLAFVDRNRGRNRES